MFSLVKDFLSKNKVVITYVRDALGFKIGVVVAVGRDKIGYSMVNHRHDYQKKVLQLHQLPGIQKLQELQLKGVQINILQSHAYKVFTTLIKEKMENYDEPDINVPLFDRNIGLSKAIEMAMNGTFKVDAWEEFQESPTLVPVGLNDDFEQVMKVLLNKPYNNYMRDAIDNMIIRSRKVKAFQV
jgi:hypothetical protein